MLQLSVIRSSTSLFLLPVLLVQKAGSSTDAPSTSNIVKDKFSIPMVDELLDNFKGTCFFTKIDLCNGYATG